MKGKSGQSLLSLYGGLDRSVYVLFIARTINRLGDFVQMLLVLILSSRIGLSDSTVGLMVTAVAFATSLGKFFGGMVADRMPRKYVMAVCQIVVCLCYCICGFLFMVSSHSIWVPIIILVSSPFRGATWPVNNALVADFTSDEDRGKAYSLLYLGTNIGVAVGPLAAGFLFARNLPLLFFGAAFLMLCTSLVILRFVPRTASERSLNVNQEQQAVTGSAWHAIWIRPMIIAYAVLFFLYEFCYCQTTFVLPLEFSMYFGPDMGASRYGLLMSINAVTVLIMTPLLTRWTSKRNHVTNMAFAMVFFIIGFGLYAAVSSYSFFLIATFIWTNGEILMATNGNVFLNHYTPSSHRGRVNGLVSVFTGLGSTFGPAVGGLLLTYGTYGSLWFAMVGVCCAICLGFVWLNSWLKPTVHVEK